MGTVQPPATAWPLGLRRFTPRVTASHVVMLSAALLAGALNWMLLQGPGEGIPIAVAGRDLTAGESVDPEAIRMVPVHLPGDLQATLIDLSMVERGAVLVRPVRAGEPLRATDVRLPAAADGLRAMSLPVASEHAVAGALAPGDRIDVIESSAGQARYLATGIEVLAVESTEGKGGIGGLRPFSVTVAVDDLIALQLALALRTSDVDLIRSTGAAPPTTIQTGAAPVPSDEEAA